MRMKKVLTKREAARHTVYYRATRVAYSMPCSEKTRIPKKGMRLAMLHPLGEFSGEVPQAQFAIGEITEVKKTKDDYIVSVRFFGGMPATMSMEFGWNYYGKFCVPAPLSSKGKTGE